VSGEGGGNLGSEVREGGIVDAAGARKVDVEDLTDASWVGREQHNAVAEADGFTDIMRDEHDSFSALREDALNISIELIARECVERGKRFVHQQHTGVRREAACKRNALAHTTRELMGACKLAIGKADEVKVVAGDLETFALGEVRLKAKSKEYVVEDVEPGEERVLLEHYHAITPRRTYGLTIEEHATSVRLLESRDERKECRLSTARGSDQADKLTLADIEVDTFEGCDLPHPAIKGFGYAAQGELDGILSGLGHRQGSREGDR
jgi:hypothetical protein